MNKNLTDITIVLDRSGSMDSCREEAENGLNHFVDEQKKVPGEAKFTLVQFDTQYEFVHRGVDIKNVGRHTLVPRGMTALLDAVGRAINETGERLSLTDDADRPGLVVFVILTDGKENSSHEFNLTQVKEMIERQSNEYKWQFTFLGANQDAFAEAGALGIKPSSAASYNPKNAGAAFAGASNNVARMREQTTSGKIVSSSYTDEERRLMGK